MLPLTTGTRPRAKQSPNTATALRKPGHMKLCVEYKGADVFIFSTSRRLFSKKCSQTENAMARSCTTHLKITALTQRRSAAQTRWLQIFHYTEQSRRELTGIFEGHWHLLQANREEAPVLFSLWRTSGAHSTALTIPCTFNTRHMGYCTLITVICTPKTFFCPFCCQSANECHLFSQHEHNAILNKSAPFFNSLPSTICLIEILHYEHAQIKMQCKLNHIHWRLANASTFLYLIIK